MLCDPVRGMEESALKCAAYALLYGYEQINGMPLQWMLL